MVKIVKIIFNEIFSFGCYKKIILFLVEYLVASDYIVPFNVYIKKIKHLNINLVPNEIIFYGFLIKV